MIAPGNRTNSTKEEFGRQLFHQILRMQAGLDDPDVFIQEWAVARCLLDAMELATPDYDLAISRLKNAHRYVDSGESGAAKYELGLLLKGLGLETAAYENEYENEIDAKDAVSTQSRRGSLSGISLNHSSQIDLDRSSVSN